MPATYINGFGGSVTFGAFNFEVVEWALKVDNGLIDVTNTGSSNYGQFIAGVNTGQVSLKTFWDTTSIYTGATANLLPGQTGSATLEIGPTNKSVVVSLIIMSIALTNSPTAGVTYDIEAKLTSAPTYPT
jgi:hypothetical protein